jgi:hypothetical protein
MCDSMIEDPINAQEAAEMLNVCSSWVTSLCREGVLVAERGSGKGKPWIISKSSVQEFRDNTENNEASDTDVQEILIEILSEENPNAIIDINSTSPEKENLLDGITEKLTIYGPGVLITGIGIIEIFIPGVATVREGIKMLINARN